MKIKVNREHRYPYLGAYVDLVKAFRGVMDYNSKVASGFYLIPRQEDYASRRKFNRARIMAIARKKHIIKRRA